MSTFSLLLYQKQKFKHFLNIFWSLKKVWKKTITVALLFLGVFVFAQNKQLPNVTILATGGTIAGAAATAPTTATAATAARGRLLLVFSAGNAGNMNVPATCCAQRPHTQWPRRPSARLLHVIVISLTANPQTHMGAANMTCDDIYYSSPRGQTTPLFGHSSGATPTMLKCI